MMFDVNGKEMHYDDRLVKQLDIMVDRCHNRKLDNLLIIDGPEGFGKSNLAMGVAHYFSVKTGRPFSVDNVFFDTDAMLNFAKSTSDQIIVWDEAVISALSSNWRSKTQQKLMTLLMMARKKRHIYIFNIPSFLRLKDYIAVDRSVALLRVYSQDGLSIGTFCYYTIRQKEFVYDVWMRSKKKEYKSSFAFNGRFPEYLPQVIDESLYDKKKDEAIEKFAGVEVVKENPWKKKYFQFVHKLMNLSIYNNTEWSKVLGVPHSTVSGWKNADKLHPELFG